LSSKGTTLLFDPFRPHFAKKVSMVRSILIVDDSPTVRHALCELFTREKDFDVCGEAENGKEAIERAKQLHPDLIVTDLSMPIMSGLEEARVLKQLMPTVPVIIYTAHSDPFYREGSSGGRRLCCGL
jgi:DNA-binding NarL/FixJ family response regulator